MILALFGFRALCTTFEGGTARYDWKLMLGVSRIPEAEP